MRALCVGGMKESTQQQIQIQETYSFGLIKLIEYLYTKQFDTEDVDNDNINKFVEVLIVSDKYGCLKVKEQVEEIMISSELTNENVSGLLVISDRHNANKLKQVCCEYIRQHYSQVIQTSMSVAFFSFLDFSSLSTFCGLTSTLTHQNVTQNDKDFMSIVLLIVSVGVVLTIVSLFFSLLSPVKVQLNKLFSKKFS
jgi:hypothetical protein